MSRKIALAVACLCEEDQKWILNQLDITQKQSMSDFLSEINDLGLNRDPSIIQSVLADILDRQPSLPEMESQKYFGTVSELDIFWQSVFYHQLDEKQKLGFIKHKNVPKENITEFKHIPKKLMESFLSSVAGECRG